MRLQTLLLLATAVLLFSSCSAQYQYGQATYYKSIDHGYCGFGRNIPSNGFVAAWPFIETGPNGQGYPQPGSDGQGCGSCFEVSCIPQWVESSDGSIYLDRRDACADPNRAVVVRVVDECRCSLPRDSSLPRGNFNWCCNAPTPRLGINRHIDLSQQAFSALVKDGNFGLGIIGIRWRRASCSRIGIVTAGSSSSPAQGPITPPSSGSGSSGPSTPPPQGGSNSGSSGSSSQGSGSQPVVVAPKDEARGNTQQLPLLAQCGGAGAECGRHGPGNNTCSDAPFRGYSCAKGLLCERQSQYYYQCVAPDRNNINTDGRYNVQPTTTPSSKPPAGRKPGKKPSAGSSKALGENEQCGGKGAKCDSYGACQDKPFPGATCAKGLSCVRQNEWYFQCEKARGSAPSNKPAGTTATSGPQQTNTNTGTNTATPSTPRRLQAAGQQCGGLGADCASLGGCVDGVWSAIKCAPGLTCTRQNQFYYECRA